MLTVYPSVIPNGYVATHSDWPNDVWSECPLAACAEVLRLVVQKMQIRGHMHTGFAQAFAELRAAGGDAWDGVEDPDAFIREVRGYVDA